MRRTRTGLSCDRDASVLRPRESASHRRELGIGLRLGLGQWIGNRQAGLARARRGIRRNGRDRRLDGHDGLSCHGVEIPATSDRQTRGSRAGRRVGKSSGRNGTRNARPEDGGRTSIASCAPRMSNRGAIPRAQEGSLRPQARDRAGAAHSSEGLRVPLSGLASAREGQPTLTLGRGPAT